MFKPIEIEISQTLQFNDNEWHVASITVLQEPTKMIFLQVDSVKSISTFLNAPTLSD